jgi:hypothetical protein
MEVSLWVTIFLGKAEINNVDLIAPLPNTHDKIVWFYITVEEALSVDVLDTREELVGKQKDSL